MGFSNKFLVQVRQLTISAIKGLLRIWQKAQVSGGWGRELSPNYFTITNSGRSARACPADGRLPPAPGTVESLFEGPLHRKNGTDENNKLNGTNEIAKGSNHVLPCVHDKEHWKDRKGEHDCPADAPRPPAIVMGKFPCVPVFPGHGGPVSENRMHVFGGVFYKIPSKRQHGHRNQQRHQQHESPQTHMFSTPQVHNNSFHHTTGRSRHARCRQNRRRLKRRQFCGSINKKIHRMDRIP